ncbi:uncharacterized protein LOC124291287 [Haliotis rubra]|uniref:uncharacterized protein LOC124291287 n=1 Tax=Haliotis rubra TaxID=36100 RepID=UPI001EE5CE8E|nr:uncharacterized protein LOC124291287 [Haliotis rubra]
MKGNANVSLAGAMTQSECGDLCIAYYADEKECAAFTHDKNSDQCMLLLQTDIYISGSPEIRVDQDSITAVKKCYNFYTSEESLKYLGNVQNPNSICTTLNSQNVRSDEQSTRSGSQVRIASSLVPMQSSDWQLLLPSPSPVAGITLMFEDTNTTSGLPIGILQPSPWELQPSSTLMHQTEPATPALPSQTMVQDNAISLHHDDSSGSELPSQTQAEDSAMSLHHDGWSESLLPSQTHVQYNANTLHRSKTGGHVLQTQAPSSTRTCRCRCTVSHTGNNTRAPGMNLTKLQVDRQKVSRYRRKLTSASDDRPSARVVGSVLGVAVLVTVGVLIVLMDVAVVLKRC